VLRPSIVPARRLASLLAGIVIVLSCTPQKVAGPNANRGPTASITRVPSGQILEGAEVTFDASSSSDPEDDSLRYVWNVGDTLARTGSTTSRSYVDEGAYDVTLIVTDANGASDTAKTRVSVENAAPVVSGIVGPAGSIGVGNPAAIHIRASDPGAADTLAMQIDWQDGTTATLGFSHNQPEAVATHTYSTVGTYAVELTIQDNDGAVTKRTIDKPIVVVPRGTPGENHAPTAAIVFPSGPVVEGRPVIFDGASSSDPDGDSLAYFWALEGRSLGNSSFAVRTFVDDGAYILTLIVRDQHGASDTTTAQVTVENRPPFIYSTRAPSGAILAGTSATIEVSASDSGQDSLTMQIDWKDGSTYTSPERPWYQGGVKLEHTYSTPGTYAVEATSRDDDGGVAKRVVGPIIVVGPHTNHPPVARIDGPASGSEGAGLFFSARNSTDPDGDSLYVTLLSGDGRSQKESRVYYSRNYGGWWSYPENGNYIVSIIVADDSGAADTASMPVTVVNAPPNKAEWLFRPDHEAVGIPASIQVLVSDPGTADQLTIAVDWGDGTGQTLGAADTSVWVPGDGMNELGGTLFHTYQTTGSYTITVTARDDEGEVSPPLTSSPVIVFDANARQTVAGYEVTDLGTLGGNWARPADLNDRGQIVGTSMTDHWALHAFLWDESGMHDLGTMGRRASEAVRINEAGLIAGTVWERGVGTLDDNCISSAVGTTWQNGVATTLGGQGFCHNWSDWYGGLSGQPHPRLVRAMNSSGDIAWIGYGKFDIRSRLWRNGWQQMPLPSPWAPFYPTSMNDRGQVVGTAHQGEGSPLFHAFLWENGAGRDLGVLAPTTCQRGVDCDRAAAQDINENGEIVGFSTGAGHYHFVLWHDDKIEDLGLADWSTGQPSPRIVVNNRGDIAGSAGGKAYFWSEGVKTQLPSSGGALEVVQLNENGDVVGNILMAGRQHIFVWSQRRGLIDLGTGPDGFDAAWVVDVNARGDILGYTAPCTLGYGSSRCADRAVDYWATQVRPILWRNTQAAASR
jgi:probable HAF family extracellular repeat protein